MKFLDPFEEEPDFVNEEGTKWWVKKGLTTYAQRPDKYGITLPNVVVWEVETKDGYRSYVITENNEIIKDSQKYEDIACHIDILKLIESTPGNGTKDNSFFDEKLRDLKEENK